MTCFAKKVGLTLTADWRAPLEHLGETEVAPAVKTVVGFYFYHELVVAAHPGGICFDVADFHRSHLHFRG